MLSLWRTLWNLLSVLVCIAAAIATESVLWSLGAVVVFNAGVFLGALYALEDR